MGRGCGCGEPTPGDVNAFSVEPLDYLAGTPLPLALGVLDDFVLHKLGCLDGSAASGLRKNCLFVWDVLRSCLLKALDPLTDTIAMHRHLGVTRNIHDAVTQVVQGLNPHPLDMSGRGTAYMQNYSPKSPEYFELLYTRGNKLEEPRGGVRGDFRLGGMGKLDCWWSSGFATS